jgi:hypothetical protein
MSKFSPGCGCCAGPGCNNDSTTLTVDFGAGGLTDLLGSSCDEIVGEIVFTTTSPNIWEFAITDSYGFAQLQLTLVFDSFAMECFWRVFYQNFDESATFETARESSATFDGSVLPVTLDLVSETWFAMCAGGLRATITVDV